MESTQNHWDTIFSTTQDSKLGWFEKDLSKTYELLNQIPQWDKSTIFIPGAGTSVLIDELLSRGVKLVLNDISAEAINRVRERIGGKTGDVFWLCQNITKPFQRSVPMVDVWIDRAVLHFLTAEKDISGYFDNLKSLVKMGGHVIFAEFSKTGAPKCAGLILHKYSIEELSGNLCTAFKLISHFDYTYINPNGDPRPYVYALFKRASY